MVLRWSAQTREDWQRLQRAKRFIVTRFRRGESLPALARHYRVGERLMRRFLQESCDDYEAVMEQRMQRHYQHLRRAKPQASKRLKGAMAPFKRRGSKWPVRRIEEFRTEELEALRQRLEAKRLEGWFKPPPTEQELFWSEG